MIYRSLFSRGNTWLYGYVFLVQSTVEHRTNRISRWKPCIEESGKILDVSYYSDHYSCAQRKGLQGWGNSIIDRMIERRVRRSPGAHVLEIGASSGEHFEFVCPEPSIGSYTAVDLLPCATNPDLASKLRGLGLMNFVSGDATQLPFPDCTFDLVLSTCVLAHVRDPEAVFQDLRRVTRTSGQIVIGMPCDPGMLNRLIKSVVTYRQMRSAGVENPKLSYAREHINPVHNLIELARESFRDDEIALRYFPFRIPTWNFNLMVSLEVLKMETSDYPLQ